MKVYVLILQKPLKIKVYSSLTALIEDNEPSTLGASKSKLQKHDFDSFDYITSRIIISKKETLSTGDIRRILNDECNQAYKAGECERGKWKEKELPYSKI
ncbi:hypothetical protein D0T53_12160 [Dysgonomonas sp. 216]|uniref:hypothetical protein n=1 Tax=Dysgonomonas sp. 216 TaxID=2302934 RepID=UPI0013D89CA7|nr:hypothetical protein [Dysgonomonas sp. 216]NDW19658.1 hypothetical protein [Dysgonomonas sp. 216]